MAITYREVKGSALTIEELDNNFRHFTGSHPIEGDLTITGSITVSGSKNSVFDIDLFDLVITGGLDVSRDVVVGDDLTVVDETTLKKETTIGYRDFSNYDFSYQLNVTASSNSDKSARFDGGIEVTGSVDIAGSITSSGNISASSFSGNGNDLNFSELQVNSTSLPPGVAVNFSQSSTNTVAAVQVVGEFRVSGSKTTHLNYNQQSTMVNYIRERVIMDELPTSKPATIGELWISGSDAAGTSGYLMVVTS